MKITIIGCGYVGSAIARFWSQAGYIVTATTTTLEKVPNLETVAQRVVVLQGNDLESLRKVVKDQAVILLCIGANHRSRYRETYLETAQNLVKALQDNPTVQQLIYTGSYAVLGDKKGAWVDESSPVAPANENGQILCETETVLLSAQTPHLKVCLLRLSGIYGPGRELIKIFRTWSGTTRPGNGEDFTNWIHLEDIVGGLELVRAQQLEGIYHLTGDEHLTTCNFFNQLFAKHGLAPLNWDASVPSIRPYNVRVSNQKIKHQGFKLIHPEIIF